MLGAEKNAFINGVFVTNDSLLFVSSASYQYLFLSRRSSLTAYM